MFYPTYKSSSGILFTYDDILLRTYLEIVYTGEFRKLIKSGNVSDQQCLTAWEELVKRQGKASGTNQYSSYIQLLKGYAKLVNDHTVIRACLVYLMFAPIRWDIIETLKLYNYPVEIKEGQIVVESLKAKLRAVENLITKAEMKRKEIERLFKNTDDKKEKKGFEEILAGLNFALGFNVDENITLARYNEYQKILKARQKQIEEQRTNKSKR